MNNDDDYEKTMVMPNPGGRRNKNIEPKAEQPSPSHPPATAQSSPFIEKRGETNPLLINANKLLVLASHLRTLQPSRSVGEIRENIERLVTDFNAQASNANCPKEHVITARYLLCCLLDELVLSTPWGIKSEWSQQTLLSKFHNETSGGEKFFLIVDKLNENPGANIDLIELSLVCLSFGFSGKYRLVDNGQETLRQIIHSLHQLIEQQKGRSIELSPSWKSSSAEQGKSNGVWKVPFYAALISFLFILSGLFIGFTVSLNGTSEPIYALLETQQWSKQQQAPSRQTNNDMQSILARLREVFGADISQNLLTIEQQQQDIIIRFTHPQLFSVGSSRINPQLLPEVNVLATEILNISNAIIVVGHTDNTGKAKSNWVISRKRAQAIASWIQSGRPYINNINTLGLADTEPLVENNNPHNRSLNRRVEIIINMAGM